MVDRDFIECLEQINLALVSERLSVCIAFIMQSNSLQLCINLH